MSNDRQASTPTVIQNRDFSIAYYFKFILEIKP